MSKLEENNYFYNCTPISHLASEPVSPLYFRALTTSSYILELCVSGQENSDKLFC